MYSVADNKKLTKMEAKVARVSDGQEHISRKLSQIDHFFLLFDKFFSSL